jgi:peptide/nickel transport system substrate-binding protein
LIDRRTKLKWRRILRRQKRQVNEIGQKTEQELERHLFRRLLKVPRISRFLAGWIGLLAIITVGLVMQMRTLGSTYQVKTAQDGGTYTEGIIGSFTNANPLYADSTVDATVSHLIFSGLLKYDQNNNLSGDLAESWTMDDTGRVFTVVLKPDVRWHDNKRITADDVVFTFKTIQNPEASSYLSPSWQNVTVQAVDSRTVTFTLPNSLSSFAHSLTTGIIPKHILQDIKPAQLRSISFNNIQPIGSGPFTLSKVEVAGTDPSDRQERIALKKFQDYHLGAPKIETYIVRTYSNEQTLTNAFRKDEVSAMVGLTQTPEDILSRPKTEEFSVPLTGEVIVFFKSDQVVLKDPAVRKALALATKKSDIADRLQYPLVLADSPFLKSQSAYDKSLVQKTNQPEEAKKILDQAGWIVDKKTGIRTKNGQKLTFTLSALASAEYSTVAAVLQEEWRSVGAELRIDLQPEKDLQTALSTHSYDALLSAISLGQDPDVFAYWHSTQADPRSSTRLNFSEYMSPKADRSLEAGRTRVDDSLRAVKYKPFLEAWLADTPAVVLYQPRFLYVVRAPLYNFEPKLFNNSSDRLNNVHLWQIRDKLQPVR